MTRIKTNVAQKGYFPPGYKLVTRGTFPGFGKGCIPVVCNWSCNSSGQPSGSNNAWAYYENNTKWVSLGNCSARSSATQAYAYGTGSGTAWLPWHFNNDWDKLKSMSQVSGTITAWLEKSGGGGVNNPFANKLLKTLKKFTGKTYEN